MHESNGTIFIVTVLTLLIFLAIFIMKYAVQVLNARAQASKKNEIDTQLMAIEEKSEKLERRVAHLEALLKEVE